VFHIGNILRRAFLLHAAALTIDAINRIEAGQHLKHALPVVILLADLIVMDLQDLKFTQFIQFLQVGHGGDAVID
jgi:hypothetical protein